MQYLITLEYFAKNMALTTIPTMHHSVVPSRGLCFDMAPYFKTFVYCVLQKISGLLVLWMPFVHDTGNYASW